MTVRDLVIDRIVSIGPKGSVARLVTENVDDLVGTMIAIEIVTGTVTMIESGDDAAMIAIGIVTGTGKESEVATTASAAGMRIGNEKVIGESEISIQIEKGGVEIVSGSAGMARLRGEAILTVVKTLDPAVVLSEEAKGADHLATSGRTAQQATTFGDHLQEVQVGQVLVTMTIDDRESEVHHVVIAGETGADDRSKELTT